MNLSDLISRLQLIHEKHGDIMFTCTCLTNHEDDTIWGTRFESMNVSDCGCQGEPELYCDLIMRSNDPRESNPNPDPT